MAKKAAKKAAKKTTPARPKGRRVRLKTKNEFDLIRLLARSQNDARKAIAELVQNSLDADARRVELTWFKEEGQHALRLRDDGGGVFSELEREEALLRIARTIGHSHKRHLSPVQRRELMVLGKYGIGLLGFWCVGEELEIRSRVGGGEVWCLRLLEDRPEGKVFRSRARRIGEEDTYTEVTIRRVHASSVNRVRPPRLQAFLAQELRGQLLDRDVLLSIRDRVVRGRATKLYYVRPKPYLGLHLEELRTLDVSGYDDARLDLYLVSEEEERRGTVALTCGGSVVLDDIASAEGEDAPRTPWDSGQLEGTIDFPDLSVAPSTRRGFVPDDASRAFFEALARLELDLLSRILADIERRAEERLRTVARELRRLFRPIAKELPEYELFDVTAGSRSRAGPAHPGAALRGVDTADVGEDEEVEAGKSDDRDAAADGLLFPPGPLALVRVAPSRQRTAPGSVRQLRAYALDADGRPARGEVHFDWELEGPGELDANGDRATYRAPAAEDRVAVRVSARQGRMTASADALITIAEDPAGHDARGGIPEPRLVNQLSEAWRSRFVDGSWEVNSGHVDYRAVEGIEARRMRYLSHLFAKELVLRNFAGAGDAELLERMVQVVTRLDVGRRGQTGSGAK